MNNRYYIGVDGCKAGWFSICIGPKDNFEFDIFISLRRLWNQYEEATYILVDIPIGLPWKSKSKRECDKEARDVLRPLRHNSVFTPPCREVLVINSYSEACTINEENCGRRLSKQMWHIIPKIKEADELLRTIPKTRKKIREIHPEVLFWALNDQVAMTYSKKQLEGFVERLQVLRRHFQRCDELVMEALTSYKRDQVAADDILDAMAAAITGMSGNGRLVSIPEIPERDAHLLPMEIVYWVSDHGRRDVH